MARKQKASTEHTNGVVAGQILRKKPNGVSGAITQPIGVDGIKRWGNRGMVWEEFLPELRGSRGVKKYREMWDNDATIGSVMHIISVILRQVKWEVRGDNDEDVDFLQSCIEDMRPTFATFICEVLSMIAFGWSWHEIVYKRRAGYNEDSSMSSKYNDGRIGWACWDIRSQDSLANWIWNERGQLIAMEQQCAPAYRVQQIPLSRSMLFRATSQKNSPEGRSMLRSAYVSWYYKRNIENFRAIGIERDLTGLPVCKMDGATAATIQDGETIYERMQRIIRNVKNDEQGSIILPMVIDPESGKEMLTFELLASPGNKQFDINAVIQQLSAAIAQVMAADFLLLGHEKVGSYSLSSDKTDMFALSLSAILQAIADPINEDAIPRLMRFNGRPTDNCPKIYPGDIETPDLTALGSYVEKLTNSGMPIWPNAALQSYLLKAANLPEPTEEELAMQAMNAEQQEEPAREPDEVLPSEEE